MQRQRVETEAGDEERSVGVVATRVYRRHDGGGWSPVRRSFQGKGARAFGRQSLTPALPLDALEPSGALDEAHWWKIRSQFSVVDGVTSE